MVGIDEESSPFISLNRLKKDFDSKRVENFENSNNSSSGLPNSNTGLLFKFTKLLKFIVSQWRNIWTEEHKRDF